MSEARRRWLCAAGSFATAALAFGGVFGGLPSRWAPVDVTAVLVTLACIGSGVLLIVKPELGARVSRVVCAAVLALGLVLVVVLAATASYLSGIYGPVGKGGAMVLTFVAVLAVPYLVVLPVAQLLYLKKPREGA